MKETEFVHLTDRGILRISGEEARFFLQGLVSNDLMRVSEKTTIYAALLTPQGKFLHDFFIIEHMGCFYLDCEANRVNDLFKRLNQFKLRAKIEIVLANNLSVVALFGENIHKKLKIHKGPGSAINWLHGKCYTDPRLSEMGVRAIIPDESLNILSQQYQFIESTFKKYDQQRILLGLPDGSRDMEIEKSTLLECGFEELNGVDFNKGCYVGQEITARTKHRGLVKKRLIPVKYSGDTLSPGSTITQTGKPVGELRSVGQSIALALIRIDAISNEQSLFVRDTMIMAFKPVWISF